MLPVAVAWSSSDDNAVHYVLVALWMSSCFHIMGQTEIQAIDDLLTMSHQIAPGTESALTNCLVATWLQQ